MWLIQHFFGSFGLFSYCVLFVKVTHICLRMDSTEAGPEMGSLVQVIYGESLLGRRGLRSQERAGVEFEHDTVSAGDQL